MFELFEEFNRFCLTSKLQGHPNRVDEKEEKKILMKSHEELSSDEDSLLDLVSSSGKFGPPTVERAAPVGDDMEAVSSDEENLGVTTSRHGRSSLLESISSDEEAKI